MTTEARWAVTLGVAYALVSLGVLVGLVDPLILLLPVACLGVWGVWRTFVAPWFRS